jgi:hypothetical protein
MMVDPETFWFDALITDFGFHEYITKDKELRR